MVQENGVQFSFVKQCVIFAIIWGFFYDFQSEYILYFWGEYHAGSGFAKASDYVYVACIAYLVSIIGLFLLRKFMALVRMSDKISFIISTGILFATSPLARLGAYMVFTFISTPLYCIYAPLEF